MQHPPETPPPLLRQPNFRRLWAGQSISVLGDQVTFIALPLVAIRTLDATPFQVGTLSALALLPHLLLSLQAGEWLDRRGNRRRVMIIADLARAATLFSLPLAYWAGSLTLGHLYVAAFINGSLAVFFDLSWSTVFVSVVPRRDFVAANARLAQSRAVAQGAGPSIGGLLVEVARAPGALVLDAASYLGSAFFVSRIDSLEPPVETGEAASIATRVSVGLRFLLGHALTRAILLSLATTNLFNLMFLALVVLYATRDLGISPAILGLVFGVGAVGGTAGAIFAPRISGALGVGPALLLGSVLFPAPLILVPAAAGPQWLVVGMLFGAIGAALFGVMVLDVNGNALMTALTPDRIRARVVGAHRTINYGIRPFGSFIGGVLGSTIGVRETLWLATVGALLGIAWLVVSPVRSVRSLPETLE